MAVAADACRFGSRRANQDRETRNLKVSFFLFAYNQEATIEAACRAALAQTYSPLEVILSDDDSRDGTFARMDAIARAYVGPHVVVLNKNERNLGLIGHVNRAFELAKGDLIVAAAGDDVSLAERTRIIVDAFEASTREPLLIHSSVLMIDANGAEVGVWRPPIVVTPPTKVGAALSKALYIGASGAWSRKLYDQFGPIRHYDTYEDLILGFRAFIEDRIHYIDRPLVRYSISGGIAGGPGGETRARASRRKEIYKTLRHSIATYAQRRDDLAFARQGDMTQIGDALQKKLRECMIAKSCCEGWRPAARSFVGGYGLTILRMAAVWAMHRARSYAARLCGRLVRDRKTALAGAGDVVR
jgi:glycosyltransferase involved in cell wall biosynthesis